MVLVFGRRYLLHVNLMITVLVLDHVHAALVVEMRSVLRLRLLDRVHTRRLGLVIDHLLVELLLHLGLRARLDPDGLERLKLMTVRNILLEALHVLISTKLLSLTLLLSFSAIKTTSH